VVRGLLQGFLSSTDRREEVLRALEKRRVWPNMNLRAAPMPATTS
jgi:hypothetical protein